MEATQYRDSCPRYSPQATGGAVCASTPNPSGRQLRSGLAISDCNDGDNPQRFCHKRSFAALSAVAPLNTSSGRQQHCLNRGGNRDVSRAL
jgi:hypothetical protein